MVTSVLFLQVVLTLILDCNIIITSLRKHDDFHRIQVAFYLTFICLFLDFFRLDSLWIRKWLISRSRLFTWLTFYLNSVKDDSQWPPNRTIH